MRSERDKEVTVLGLRLPVSAVIRERQAFAESTNTGLLAPELEMAGRAEADVSHLILEIVGFGSVPAIG